MCCRADESAQLGFSAASTVAFTLAAVASAPGAVNLLAQQLCDAHRKMYAQACVKVAIRLAFG